MTAIEKAEELATRYLEDFDISTPGQRYEGLRWRVFQALTEAVAEERERCAKVVELHTCGMYLGTALNTREVRIVDDIMKTIPRELAAAIRKVKP